MASCLGPYRPQRRSCAGRVAEHENCKLSLQLDLGAAMYPVVLIRCECCFGKELTVRCDAVICDSRWVGGPQVPLASKLVLPYAPRRWHGAFPSERASRSLPRVTPDSTAYSQTLYHYQSSPGVHTVGVSGVHTVGVSVADRRATWLQVAQMHKDQRSLLEARRTALACARKTLPSASLALASPQLPSPNKVPR